MTWQPIETAPANGEMLLRIEKLPWPGYTNDGKVWSRAHGICNEKDPHSRHIVKATHWMPLPPPPSTGG